MNFLDKILEVKKEEVKKLKQRFTFSSFMEEEFFNTQTISLTKSINKSGNISLIAEIKKASPSKGILIENFDHINIASIYMECSVQAISILTDNNFFKGHINFLKDIARIKTVPLLRKDFIIDEFQVYEAKASGADAVLLIAEALSKNQIDDLTSAAVECGMEVLLELHSISQLDKINFNKNNLIGINNRNLITFDVDLNTTLTVSKHLPEYVTIVSESGINNKEDINKIKQTKVNAVLVGEHFMKSNNIKETVKEFIQLCNSKEN